MTTATHTTTNSGKPPVTLAATANPKPKAKVAKAKEKAPATGGKESTADKKLAAAVSARLSKKSETKTPVSDKEKKDSGPTGVRYEFSDSAKIRWKAEGNPCRPETRRWERVERVRKFAGKTWADLRDAGCKPRTLHVCVERGWAEVI